MTAATLWASACVLAALFCILILNHTWRKL